jgi:hypothetical protein
MANGTIDLRKEQEATLARRPYHYSWLARVFFRSMDMLTGAEDTLAKARLVEALAPIPYHAWEQREYEVMSSRSEDAEAVGAARAVAAWGHEAKVNEYQHVTVLNEKLREDGVPDPRYLRAPLPWLMIGSWALTQWVVSRVSLRRAFVLNAEFEDHSEHVYAALVRDHPEWEDQPATGPLVREYGEFASWAEVFRRIGLDERDHMNHSFLFADRPEQMVKYEAMPELHKGA